MGLLVCIVLWMLINTRNIVTKRVILPGIISGFTKKLQIINIELSGQTGISVFGQSGQKKKKKIVQREIKH